jgi:hypothetical protein
MRREQDQGHVQDQRPSAQDYRAGSVLAEHDDHGPKQRNRADGLH